MHDDHETIEHHESYGMFSLTRPSGVGRLFGSPLSEHIGTWRLRIYQGERRHKNGFDRYYAANHRAYIEVDLSAAQFAEALASQGLNDGMPCTIRHFNGKSMAEVPATESTEMHRAQGSFKARMASFVRDVRVKGDTIKAILEKDRLSKGDKEVINGFVQGIINELASNAPSFVEFFAEVTGKVANHAKLEIAAMLEHTISRVGMDRIAALRQPEKTVLEMPAHDDDPQNS